MNLPIRMNRPTNRLSISMFLLIAIWPRPVSVVASGFRAGASSIDISPRALPAIRNGGFLQAVVDRVDDPLHARCLVLSTDTETFAIAIVDSCMFPTDVCDAIKQRVANQINIATDRILISATHTHSAPSVMSLCLGTSRDEAYTAYVIPRVAEAIVAAHTNLRPAKIGWASRDLAALTHCRRWITRSDRMGMDPFGFRSVRAMMHPGYLNPDYVSPAGPVDPELFVLSVVTAEQQPICLLANYSMHYFGGTAGFSADYFGQVAANLESHFDRDDFVGIMSQGTSGDLHWMDYGKPQRQIDRRQYASEITQAILATEAQIQYQNNLSLAMAEKRLKLMRRLPDDDRLAWANSINERRGDRPPRDRPEVYAQQAVWIDAHRETEVVLQALRIGELAITALPNEVYGITGLKLKQQSPLQQTFNLELANGAEGYIPPPEQHRLGGYTTWPARTAGLEVGAEPQIVETVLSLLETVSGMKRRPHVVPPCSYSHKVIESNPVAYWRLDDITSDQATDQTGTQHGDFDGGIALYLPGRNLNGPDVSSQNSSGQNSNPSATTANRCAYFAGGRLCANLAAIPTDYSVELWIRNELPCDRRPVTGYFMTRGIDGADGAPGDCLGIGGTHSNQGRLFVYNGNQRQEMIAGVSELAVGRWYHVAMTRSGTRVQVLLDGKLEIDDQLSVTFPADCHQFQIGGRNDNFANFDGRIDEVAIYDRVLDRAEIALHAGAVKIAPDRDTQ